MAQLKTKIYISLWIWRGTSVEIIENFYFIWIFSYNKTVTLYKHKDL